MYKWIEPKICSNSLEGAKSLPVSGVKKKCPPCNPGFYVTNTSSCEPCPKYTFSNGTSKSCILFVTNKIKMLNDNVLRTGMKLINTISVNTQGKGPFMFYALWYCTATVVIFAVLWGHSFESPADHMYCVTIFVVPQIF